MSRSARINLKYAVRAASLSFSTSGHLSVVFFLNTGLQNVNGKIKKGSIREGTRMKMDCSFGDETHFTEL